MGKKRVIKKPAEEPEVKSAAETKPRAAVGEPRLDGREVNISSRGIARGIAHIQATYNNTIIAITDNKGNVVVWSSAGSIGFSGTKKATPFAAARVAETAAEKAKRLGMQAVMVRVSGVGSGRDSAIRSLANHGLEIVSVKDITPIPHNGPRPPKPRRV